jgi:hypothetical protein
LHFLRRRLAGLAAAGRRQPLAGHLHVQGLALLGRLFPELLEVLLEAEIENQIVPKLFQFYGFASAEKISLDVLREPFTAEDKNVAHWAGVEIGDCMNELVFR